MVCLSNIDYSDSHLQWEYNPFERTYRERVIDKNEIAALEWIRQTDPGHTTPERIGEETVNGHPCEIYRYIDKNFNQPVKEWRSKLHPNLPLKCETGDPPYEIAEVLEFSFDKIGNDVFMYPKGYQKVTAINPSFLIDYRYYPMVIDYPFIPAIDMKNISIGKDPTTGEVYGDIWVRWFTPENKISVKEAIPFKEFNESSVFTEHLLISKNKKMCRLSIIKSDLKGNELWRKDYARTWNQVSKNDVYDIIIEKVMDLINRNTDTQGHFSISFWGIK
jgi:hypothetical protein